MRNNKRMLRGIATVAGVMVLTVIGFAAPASAATMVEYAATMVEYAVTI